MNIASSASGIPAPEEKRKKPRHPLHGLSICASMWLWGAILFYSPMYLGVTGGWRTPFNVLGSILLTISFGGALLELGGIKKKEGFEYFGTGVVFLIPSAILFYIAATANIAQGWMILIRVLALLLLAFAGPFFFMGFPYFIDMQTRKSEGLLDENSRPLDQTTDKSEPTKPRLVTATSILVALLSLITAVIKLVAEISN